MQVRLNSMFPVFSISVILICSLSGFAVAKGPENLTRTGISNSSRMTSLPAAIETSLNTKESDTVTEKLTTERASTYAFVSKAVLSSVKPPLKATRRSKHEDVISSTVFTLKFGDTVIVPDNSLLNVTAEIDGELLRSSTVAPSSTIFSSYSSKATMDTTADFFSTSHHSSPSVTSTAASTQRTYSSKPIKLAPARTYLRRVIDKNAPLEERPEGKKNTPYPLIPKTTTHEIATARQLLNKTAPLEELSKKEYTPHPRSRKVTPRSETVATQVFNNTASLEELPKKEYTPRPLSRKATPRFKTVAPQLLKKMAPVEELPYEEYTPLPRSRKVTPRSKTVATQVFNNTASLEKLSGEKYTPHSLTSRSTHEKELYPRSDSLSSTHHATSQASSLWKTVSRNRTSLGTRPGPSVSSQVSSTETLTTTRSRKSFPSRKVTRRAKKRVHNESSTETSTTTHSMKSLPSWRVTRPSQKGDHNGSEELVPPVESREKFFGGSFTVPSAYNVTQAESGLASAVRKARRVREDVDGGSVLKELQTDAPPKASSERRERKSPPKSLQDRSSNSRFIASNPFHASEAPDVANGEVPPMEWITLASCLLLLSINICFMFY